MIEMFDAYKLTALIFLRILNIVSDIIVEVVTGISRRLRCPKSDAHEKTSFYKIPIVKQNEST